MKYKKNMLYVKTGSLFVTVNCKKRKQNEKKFIVSVSLLCIASFELC